ncbi:MAG TPA: hypothetical protein PKY59_25820 [Pyrinomonadaceae bacterium]|nr:hypothetical protein [Pyrinomonadaceae bacterium]
MLKIKNLLSANKIFAFTFAVVILFSATLVVNSYWKKTKTACVFSQKTYYFSDAAHTSVVGYTGYLCNGTFVKSGKKTSFTDTLYCDCNEDTK